jgi:phosphomannomutase / phosphoglucomutase
MSESTAPPSRFSPAALGALRQPILAGAAAVLLLAALYAAWTGWQETSSRADAERTIATRDRLVDDLGKRLADSRAQFGKLLDNRFVQADIAAGAYDDVPPRLQASWPALTRVAVYGADLEQAFSGDMATFGYARLALLSAAVTRTDPVIGVVGKGDAAALGMAAAVLDGERPTAIVYGELAPDILTTPVAQADVDGGYLELRVGQLVLARKGDAALRQSATARPLPGTELQLAAATPGGGDSDASTALFRYIAAVLLAALAVGLLLASRRKGEPSSAAAEDMTLSEAMALSPAKEQAQRSAAPSAAAASAAAAAIDRSIFRAYDIRGVVGTTLDEGVARLIGQAVGTVMQEKGLREIVVGRDGRLSGPALSAALIEGLRRAGCDVIDIGLAPTPLVYFATYQLNTGSGIAVTGSHNPPDYNGFKIMIGGDTLSGDAITDLYARIAENRLRSEGKGGVQQMDMAADYISRVASDVQLERRMRVVIDCGNGVAGALAPQILEAIGADAEPLYCEVDGTFPNHHPDPSDPENLKDLITAVQRTGAEIGLAFDGDGDRLGVVTRQGEVIYPDRLLMLFAQDVLSRNPGANVIYDVKCTGHLASHILRHGGSPIMWKTGHSLIKGKMRETEAELAGEMSGHFFFRERWYGFDDGIYSAARLLEILAADDRDPEEIFAELPKGVSTPELKVVMEEGEHYAYIERFRAQSSFEGAKVITIDGVRADWPDGWGLVRCSNTTPSLVLRFDADNEAALARIQGTFRTQLLAVDPSLKLPF